MAVFRVHGGGDEGGVGGVDVAHDDALARREVGQQAVGAAVEVVAGDDLVAGPQQARDDVERAHAGADGEHALGRHDLGEVALEVGAGRVAGARVVVLLLTAGRRRLLEGGRLVDGDARGAVLVLGLGVDELGGEERTAAARELGDDGAGDGGKSWPSWSTRVSSLDVGLESAPIGVGDSFGEAIFRARALEAAPVEGGGDVVPGRGRDGTAASGMASKEIEG